MKRTLLYTIIISLPAILSCQHQLQWNRPSEGTIMKDAGGNCLPVTVAGNFTSNKTINDSNFLTVNIAVTVKGEYAITSDSVNGYLFKAAGIFKQTGNVAVSLACSGKPLTAGTNHFTVRYSNSVCEAYVTVKPDTVAVSKYTLQGSPGNCLDDSVMGYYIQTVPLDTLNKVIIKVNVITPGSYSITTAIVNGYSFSASGIFNGTGIQTVKLSGSGVPAVAGNNLFTVAGGFNTCGFPVTVVPVVPVVNQSYFPLTEGSYWTYTTDAALVNTVTRTIKGDTIINTLRYSRMNETPATNSSIYLFNQNIYDYTEFGRVDKYTLSFQYGSNVYGQLPFLKEHLSTGQAWESEEFKGIASFGQVIFTKCYYKCLDNDAAITANGQGFKNVYLIAMYPELRSENNQWGSTGEIYYYYYAKGVGLVRMKKSVSGYLNEYAMQIKTWHVN